MTRPGLLKSQINNRYSVKRTHTPFGNAVKDFRSWVRENSVVSGQLPEVSQLRLPKNTPVFREAKCFTALPRSGGRLND